MGLDRSFYIVTGTKLTLDDFNDRFADTYEFERMDNDLLAFDGGETEQEEVVIGKIIAEFSKHGDLQAMHSQDLKLKHSKARPQVELELEEIGIDRPLSIYTVAQVR